MRKFERETLEFPASVRKAPVFSGFLSFVKTSRVQSAQLSHCYSATCGSLQEKEHSLVTKLKSGSSQQRQSGGSVLLQFESMFVVTKTASG